MVSLSKDTRHLFVTPHPDDIGVVFVARLLAVLGVGFAFLIHNEDAVATMKPTGDRARAAPVH
jgi:hypothetical protein